MYQWKAYGRTLGVILGAMLVVTLIAVLPTDGPQIDPSELDGGPDGTSLERPLFFAACAVALLLYGIVVAVVIRRWSRHRGSTDRVQAKIPRATYFGAVPVLIYLLVVGDGITLGYLVPVGVAILGGVFWSVAGTRRARGLAWVIGATAGAALGCHVLWMASIATSV